VFERSRLETAALLPRIEASLGLDPETTGYYRESGPGAGGRFWAFHDRMNRVLVGQGQDAAARGAREAMSALGASGDVVDRARPPGPRLSG
jgi:heme oxygenase